MRSSVMFMLVVVTVGFGGGCGGRANPRIKTVTVPAGAIDIVRDYSYDDQGRLAKVERDDGNTETIELQWDGALLVKITTTSGDNESVNELEYEGDRLVKATESAEDEDTERTLDYDDAGRLSELASAGTFTGGTDSTKETFEYDDAGALANVESTSSFAFDGQDAQSSTTKTEIQIEDGKIQKLIRTNDADEESKVEARYEDSGLLAGFTAPTSGFDANGVEVEGTLTITYSYDDSGRIESALQESSIEGEDPQETTIEYEDGDASSLDVTPFEVLPFGLWDLKGAAYTTFDIKTQVARLGGGAGF